MKCYSLLHLDDHILERDLATIVSHDCDTTASMLAHIAEMDERRLYLRSAYPSMYLYCVRKLHMSEGTAFKRIRAARMARQFPAIFPALAGGRLHVSAVVLLASHLTPDNAEELLATATHKSKAEIEVMLAQRFPRPDVPTLVQAIAGTRNELSVLTVEAPGVQLSPGTVGGLALQQVTESAALFPAKLASEPVARAKFTPLSPERFALQVTVSRNTYEQMCYAQSLLGHALPSCDIEKVLERVLDLAVEVLEQKKFARCARSRPRRSHANGRYVPAEIRRTVWQRDGGQCTFVSEKGKRCEERTRLEFDHVDPVARGGQTTADRMRLRCRAHNQYDAECAYGAGFMREKRQEGRRGVRRAEAQAREHSQAQVQPKCGATAESASGLDVLPWLRRLGFSAEEARRGATLCADIPEAPLEKRVRVALRGLAPNCMRRAAHVAT